MIKIRIRNADHEIDIRFPISESELFAKLGEIHAVEGRDAAQSAFVTGVYWPEELQTWMSSTISASVWRASIPSNMINSSSESPSWTARKSKIS